MQRRPLALAFVVCSVVGAGACADPASEPDDTSSSTTEVSSAGTTAAVDTGATTRVDESGTAAGESSTGEPPPDVLRLSDLQAEGSHNSYHLAGDPSPPVLDYTLPPIPDQLQMHGVRQFELDVHYEPEGFFTVFHIPGIDEGSSCPTLAECLTQLETWSSANPTHHILFVLLEPKDDVDVEKIVGHYEELEQEILSVWPRKRVLAPEDVQGDHATLRDAIVDEGWPLLDDTRGMAMFVLFDRGIHRDEYAGDGTDLAGKLMFPTSDLDRPDAAFLKMDEPTTAFSDIQAAVQMGFLVRTRADAELVMPDATAYDRLQTALDSGAQMVSTDYPDEEGRYWVEIPDGTPSRCNPVTNPVGCTSAAIESL